MLIPGELSLVVRSGLGNRREAWDALVAEQALPTPFLRSWWLENVGTGRPEYLLVLDAGALVGGVPLSRDRYLGVPRYRFLGQGALCPDHLDIVAAPGHEDAVSGVLREWFAGGGQKLLDLSGLVEGSLASRTWPGAMAEVDVVPFRALPGTTEEFLASFSRNFRHNLRRSDRRLDAAHVSHRESTPQTLPADLTAFRELQKARPDRGRLVRQLDLLFPAVVEGVRRGEVRVDVWETPTTPVAVSFLFLTSGRMSLYQLARTLDPAYAGLGNVANYVLITMGISDGMHEADMLRGAEAYKQSFADSKRRIVSLRVARGPAARSALRISDALVHARPRVSRVVKRLRRSV